MAELPRQGETIVDLRRYPRHRVSAPFVCAFSLLGLKRWTAADRNGLGVVLDISIRGAKVMTAAAMTPGDRLAVTLRVPDQMTAVQLDAVVRWMKDQLLGLEFMAVPLSTESRLKKFLARSTDACV